jgi:hypothetical protein
MATQPSLLRIPALVLCLSSTAAMHAADFTVGPGGTHATIQAAIGAALLIGQKTEPVALEGKGIGKLAGKDVRETLRYAPPFGPATLRTTLRVFVPGANAAHELELDVLLEPQAPQDPI